MFETSKMATEPTDTRSPNDAINQQMLEQLSRIETVLEELRGQRCVKEYYTTAEVAKMDGKAEFTVREWCRLGRLNAEKRQCGRGKSREWMISSEELIRFRNHGLLPNPAAYQHPR